MSDDNKEGAGVPVAWEVRNAEISYHAVFATEREARGVADQHDEEGYSQAAVRALYATPPAMMPAAPSDADARLLHAFGRRTAFEIGDHALPLMLGPNWNHQGCYGENSEWLCLRFNSIEERDEFRAAARAWENVARERADAACQACGDSGVVTDTEGHKWPCYQRCSALSQTMQPQAEPSDAVRPCEYCDDTGDVHGLDGEWRGVCICPAGVALAQPVQEVATTPAIPKGDLSKVWQAADDVCEWLNYEVSEKSPGLLKSIETLNEAMGRAEIRAGRAEPAAGEQAGAVAMPITAAIMIDDGGEKPAYCLMAAYASERDANTAMQLLTAPGAAIAAREQEPVPVEGFSDDKFWRMWRATNKDVNTGDILKNDIVFFGRVVAATALASRKEAPATPPAAIPAAPSGATLPPMPAIIGPRPHHDDQPNDYLESDESWSMNNPDAVSWLADNHAAIRAALPQPTTVQQAETLLTEWEQKAVLADPMGLECLINYHDCQEAGADAMEPGAGKGNEQRALELLKLGREIIARDPELWDDVQKRAFALRHSERAALKTAQTTALPGGNGEGE